jgi:hypothetical protein
MARLTPYTAVVGPDSNDASGRAMIEPSQTTPAATPYAIKPSADERAYAIGAHASHAKSRTALTSARRIGRPADASLLHRVVIRLLDILSSATRL